MVGRAGAGIGGSNAGSAGAVTVMAGRGSAGAPPVTRCNAGVASGGPYFGASDERETYEGDNGSFTDTCDDGGNLIAYGCDGTYETTGPQATRYYRTNGSVTSTTIDCGGRCVSGACPDSCPALADPLNYTSVAADGSVTLVDLSTGWSYACELYAEGSTTDCKTKWHAGDRAAVTSQSGPCPNGAGFTVGDANTVCEYFSCVATPP